MIALLTGGAACGKSQYGEGLVTAMTGPFSYIATSRICDDEMRAKVARHQAVRAEKGFITYEQPVNMQELRLPGGSALLECLATLTANEVFDESGTVLDPVDKIVSGVQALARQCDNLVLVTNTVDCEPSGSLGEGTLAYIDALSRINRRVAAMCDLVYEVVCGIPILIRGDESLNPLTCREEA